MRTIKQPTRVEYFKLPEGWNQGKYYPSVAPSSGKHAEAKILPDGRIAVALSDLYTMGGQPFYLVYESEQAYRDAVYREPRHDPEERGCRYYASDCRRLGIYERELKPRGYENVVDCGSCCKTILYSQAKYLADGDGFPAYHPRCSACYDAATITAEEMVALGLDPSLFEM